MNVDEAHELVTFLGAAYPTQRARMQPGDVRGMLAAYTAGLLDLDYERVKVAVQNLIRGTKWIPTIAEIREAIVNAEHGTPRAGGEAWGDVIAAIRRFGWSRTPGKDFHFDDPIVADIVRSLGWYDLCHSENGISDRKQFVDAYEIAARRERSEIQIETGATAKRLPGAPVSQGGNRPQISESRDHGAEAKPKGLAERLADREIAAVTPRGMKVGSQGGWVCDGDHGEPPCFHPHCWHRDPEEIP